MEIQGKLIKIFEPVTGESANGQWKRQDFLIETTAQYPKKVCFTINNDKAQIDNLQPGDLITVSFNVESREYNGRWMTNFRAWRVTPGANGQSTPLEVVGTVISVLPERSGNGTKGPWTVQEYVIETQEQFNPKVCFSVWNKKIAPTLLENGKLVTVSIDIDSREGKNGGWFASVQAWKALQGAVPTVQNTGSYGVPTDTNPLGATNPSQPVQSGDIQQIQAEDLKPSDETEDLPF